MPIGIYQSVDCLNDVLHEFQSQRINRWSVEDDSRNSFVVRLQNDRFFIDLSGAASDDVKHPNIISVEQKPQCHGIVLTVMYAILALSETTSLIL
jgi:hypothetical protein